MALANHEIVTLAVFRLGGVSKAIDTEDVAVEANKMAPARFVWKKYPEQINLEHIRVYLSDAKKTDKGEYLIGTGTDGWMLTPAGLAFAREQETVAEGLVSTNLERDRPRREQKWFRSEESRLVQSPAFKKVTAGEFATKRELERFFRVDGFVRGEARKTKVMRIVNTFSKHPQLGVVVAQLAKQLDTEKETS